MRRTRRSRRGTTPTSDLQHHQRLGGDGDDPKPTARATRRPATRSARRCPTGRSRRSRRSAQTLWKSSSHCRFATARSAMRQACAGSSCCTTSKDHSSLWLLTGPSVLWARCRAERGAVHPVVEVLLRRPPCVHEVHVAVVGGPQQLEGLEPRRIDDLARARRRSARSSSSAPLGGNGDGIDPDDTHGLTCSYVRRPERIAGAPRCSTCQPAGTSRGETVAPDILDGGVRVPGGLRPDSRSRTVTMAGPRSGPVDGGPSLPRPAVHRHATSPLRQSELAPTRTRGGSARSPTPARRRSASAVLGLDRLHELRDVGPVGEALLHLLHVARRPARRGRRGQISTPASSRRRSSSARIAGGDGLPAT